MATEADQSSDPVYAPVQTATAISKELSRKTLCCLDEIE